MKASHTFSRARIARVICARTLIIREAEHIGRRAWRRKLEDYPDVPFPVRLDTSEPI
jgi:hypothetical protein